MADPIIITEDDKRIRELIEEAGLQLSDFIAVDRFGWLEAHRFTVQDIINLVGPSVAKQNATSGPTNPDNASGLNGDFYYKVPADKSSVTHYQKIGGSWSQIFTVDIPLQNQLIKQYSFTRADLINVADGMGDLVLPFTGGQIAIGLVSRSEITDEGIPTGILIANLSGGAVTSYNQIPDTDQHGIVYYVGEAVQPSFESSLALENNSSTDSIYGIGVSEGTLIAGQTYSSSISEELAGQSIYVNTVDGQTCVYTLYNLAGSVLYTFTQIGEGSINGLPIDDNQIQEFIISNT